MTNNPDGLSDARADACDVPPSGWWCSREAGHEGPCAARPEADDANKAGGMWYRRWFAAMEELRLLRSTPPASDAAVSAGEVREWPDIGEDPMKGRPYADRMAASADAIRKAYTVQQPIVPDQTALVWRWHLGALLEAETRLRALLSRNAAAAPKVASDTCPFCTGASEYQGDPEDAFCERHLRLYRKASAA